MNYSKSIYFSFKKQRVLNFIVLKKNFHKNFCRYFEIDRKRLILHANHACNEKLMFVANKIFKFQNVYSKIYSKHDFLHFKSKNEKNDRNLNVHSITLNYQFYFKISTKCKKDKIRNYNIWRFNRFTNKKNITTLNELINHSKNEYSLIIFDKSMMINYLLYWLFYKHMNFEKIKKRKNRKSQRLKIFDVSKSWNYY